MQSDKLINIGKIIGVFGIKGELKIYSESDFIDYRFRIGAHIYLKSKKFEKTLHPAPAGNSDLIVYRQEGRVFNLLFENG